MIGFCWFKQSTISSTTFRKLQKIITLVSLLFPSLSKSSSASMKCWIHIDRSFSIFGCPTYPGVAFRFPHSLSTSLNAGDFVRVWGPSDSRSLTPSRKEETDSITRYSIARAIADSVLIIG